MFIDEKVKVDWEEIREKETEVVKLRLTDIIPVYGMLEYGSRTNFCDMEFYHDLPVFNQMSLYAYNVILGMAFLKYLESAYLF